MFPDFPSVKPWGSQVQHAHLDTQRLISTILGASNAPAAAPDTPEEWECIALWAVTGYLVASGRRSPDEGLVTLLRDAAGILDGRGRMH